MKTFKEYSEALTHAQDQANLLRRPMGLEKDLCFGRPAFSVRCIPLKAEDRYGCDATCEVVPPTK